MGIDLARRVTETPKDLLRPWQGTYSGVSVTHEVVTASPGARLVEAAQGAAMLVVGRRARKAPLGPHIGHVAHGMIHHSSAPVGTGVAGQPAGRGRAGQRVGGTRRRRRVSRATGLNGPDAI
ncbi:universal stress protein [Streptomyces sp. HUAS TT3]|uniref:universal stress protein n=1 Tax=Streptomyces sp. HUAS TT3 TaxID=3447510 RepID=UPI003F654E68